MIATADDRWMAFGDDADGAPSLSDNGLGTLPLGTLAGAPLVHDGTWICTTQAGDVFRSRCGDRDGVAVVYGRDGRPQLDRAGRATRFGRRHLQSLAVGIRKRGNSLRHAAARGCT